MTGPKGRPTTRALGSRIHQGLVGARELIGTRYLADPTLRREYERDVAPRTTVALRRILREVFASPGGSGRPRRVLDLGVGTGAASAAVRDHFGQGLEIVGIDREPIAPDALVMDVTDMGALARAAASRGKFDLVVAAQILNELYLGGRDANRVEQLAALVQRWSELLLADGGTLILVEPALRDTSRALLAVRDRLLAAGLHIVAPCFFTGPCPALVRERDWCHDSVPPLSRGAGGGAGAPPAVIERPVDFSYLVVRAVGEPTSDPTLFRVVSDPLPEKGRLKVFACGTAGRHAIVRLDRHATDANADFDGLKRGDVVRIARTTFAQDGLRAGNDTAVSRQARSGDHDRSGGGEHSDRGARGR